MLPLWSISELSNSVVFILTEFLISYYQYIYRQSNQHYKKMVDYKKDYKKSRYTLKGSTS